MREFWPGVTSPASIDRTQARPIIPMTTARADLYASFPMPTYGALAAWAWLPPGVDALLQLPQVRGDAIALTALRASRLLLAGATDERMPLPNLHARDRRRQSCIASRAKRVR